MHCRREVAAQLPCPPLPLCPTHASISITSGLGQKAPTTLAIICHQHETRCSLDHAAARQHQLRECAEPAAERRYRLLRALLPLASWVGSS